MTPLALFNCVATLAGNHFAWAKGAAITFAIENVGTMFLVTATTGVCRSTRFYIRTGKTADFELPTLDVPDALDALHLIGMLVEAVDGRVTSMALLDESDSPEMFVPPGDCWSAAAVVGRDAARQDDPAETVPATAFPLFDQVCEIVQAIPVGIRMRDPVLLCTARPWWSARVLRVAVGAPGEYAIRWFHEGPPVAGPHNTMVPSIYDGLKMVEMLRVALGIEHVDLGFRGNEMNAALQDRFLRAQGDKFPTWGRHCIPMAIADHHRQAPTRAGAKHGASL